MEKTTRTKGSGDAEVVQSESEPACGVAAAVETTDEADGKTLALRDEEAVVGSSDDATEDAEPSSPEESESFDDLLAAAEPQRRAGPMRYAAVGSIALLAVAATIWTFNSPSEGPAIKRRTAEVVSLPDVRLSLPDAGVSGKLGSAVALPVEMAAQSELPKGSFALVRGVPERAMLSTGKPFGAGTWLLQPDELSRLSLTIFAAQSEPSRIAVELLTPGGRLMARTETMVAAVATAVAEARSVDRVEPAAYPPLKAERTAEAEERSAASERVEQPARSNRKAARPAESKSAASPSPPKARLTATTVPQPPPQPKTKSAWTMNWNSLSYSR